MAISDYSKNLASGVLTSSLSSSASGVSVNCGTGSASTLTGVWPLTPFYATIMPKNPSAGVANRLDSEIVKVTNLSSDGSTVSMTFVRAQKNTTAKSFSEGDVIVNGIYNDADSFYATTNSSDGASTMAYKITSDSLPQYMSDGDTIRVSFSKDAVNQATLDVNGSTDRSIYCPGVGHSVFNTRRMDGDTVRPLIRAGVWYTLTYRYDATAGDSYWVLENEFQPVNGRWSIYHNTSTSSAGDSQTILYTDMSLDISHFSELIITAFSPQSSYTSYRTENRVSAEGLKASGRQFTIINAGEPRSATGSQFEWMRCTAGSTGLVFDHCCILRGSSSQSSTGTIYNGQPVRVADIWGVNYE